MPLQLAKMCIATEVRDKRNLRGARDFAQLPGDIQGRHPLYPEELALEETDSRSSEQSVFVNGTYSQHIWHASHL